MDTRIIPNSDDKQKLNIEQRAASRLQSVFSAIGQVINDFYLEIGIFCVGAFNALMVSKEVYDGLIIDNQPLGYSRLVAVVAFISVEGLAVYLVGAAAKTKNAWLWFFSVLFAAFFTFAHYKSMSSDFDVSRYITVMIPLFVVIGYWGRTLKLQAEYAEIDTREREKDDRNFDRQLQLEKLDKNHEIKLAKISAKNSQKGGQNGTFLAENSQNLEKANQTKKDKIAYRREKLLALTESTEFENMTQSDVANKFGVSLGTIKNDLKALNGSVRK